jgi:hypothetical protein
MDRRSLGAGGAGGEERFGGAGVFYQYSECKM